MAESRQSFSRLRTRIDERERVVDEEIDVDRAHWERGGNNESFDAHEEV
jgi:hypothetical protein